MREILKKESECSIRTYAVLVSQDTLPPYDTNDSECCHKQNPRSCTASDVKKSGCENIAVYCRFNIECCLCRSFSANRIIKRKVPEYFSPAEERGMGSILLFFR